MGEVVSIANPWSVDFVNSLIREFRSDWEALLAARKARKQDVNGELKAVLSMRNIDNMIESPWRVAPPPADLLDRRVEIIGPAHNAHRAIVAMNSGAQGYVVDGEDSLCPTWANVHATQFNLWALVRRALRAEKNDIVYKLNDHRAVLHYRPRGLHMIDTAWRPGHSDPASLVDAGLFVYHNAAELLFRGSGPYLYLPKLETEHEARFWHSVAKWMEKRLELPSYSIRFTVLVETLPALLRLEHIVWVLRKRLIGLSACRWDYAFSCVKTLQHEPYVLPARRKLAMTKSQFTEYTRWIVNVAHRRGCHAIGDEQAMVLSRKDKEGAKLAMLDKKREVLSGYDGTRVAHPDFVIPVRDVFDSVLKGRIEQRDVVFGKAKLNKRVVCSSMRDVVTDDDVRLAVRSVLVYIDAWLRGNGRIVMNGVVEDASMVEVSRVLLWRWIKRDMFMRDYVETVVRGEAASLASAGTEPRQEAIELLLKIVVDDNLAEFFTLPAYDMIAS